MRRRNPDEAHAMTTPLLLRASKAHAYAFRDAPRAVKESVTRYFEYELGLTIPPNQKVWVGSIPTKTLIAAVLPGARRELGVRDWNEYHAWYTEASGDPRTKAPDEEKHWPVILADRGDDEPILDGWHRFHRYVDMGMTSIPIVWISPEVDMRRRNPDEAEIKFLLKVSKKGKGALDMDLAKRSLGLLGWRIDDEVVALPGNRKQYEISQILDRDLAGGSGRVRVTYDFDAKQAWAFSAEKASEVQDLKRRFLQQFTIVKESPTDPEPGRWYATEPSDPQYDGYHWYFFVVKKIWLGVAGWIITTPSGASAAIPGPIRPPRPGEGYALPTFWTFGYKHGLAEDAKRYLDTIGSQALAEATATKAERERILQRRSSMPEIESVFREVTDAQYKAILKWLTQSYIDRMHAVVRFQNERPNERLEIYKFQPADRLMKQVYASNNRDLIWVPKDDYKEEAARLAKQSADEARDNFIYKNTFRISEIAKAKGAIPTAKILDMTGGGTGYDSEILFTFPDGSHFTLRNKTVWKHSPLGLLFAQFPTTFHDVVLPGGKKMSTPNEARMLDVFAVAKKPNPRRRNPSGSATSSRLRSLADRLARGG